MDKHDNITIFFLIAFFKKGFGHFQKMMNDGEKVYVRKLSGITDSGPMNTLALEVRVSN
jgi:hypothetical protein